MPELAKAEHTPLARVELRTVLNAGRAGATTARHPSNRFLNGGVVAFLKTFPKEKHEMKEPEEEMAALGEVRDCHDTGVADKSWESGITYLEQAKKKNSHQRLILSRLRRIPNGSTCLPQCFPEDASTQLLVIASGRRTPRDHQSHG